MAKLEITLSRAHKIAERLKAKATELTSESERLARSVGLSGKTAGKSQTERLASQGAQAIEMAVSAERHLRAVANVRAIIGRENEKRGINALLAKSDAVNKAISLRKSIVDQAKDGAITVGEFAEFTPLSEDSYMRSVMVNVFTDEQRAALASDLAKLQREAFALADQVAEANAGRFALELDDDMAAEVTGA